MVTQTRIHIAALLIAGLAFMPAAHADHHHHRHGGANTAAIIGGIIGLGLGAAIAGSTAPPPYYAPPPVYYPYPGYYRPPPPAVYYGAPYYYRRY